jgi:death-on-curing protein
MSDIEYLTLDDLLVVAHAYLGRPAEVGDYGLLESALARPQASVFGQDAYPTMHGKAAALMHSLVCNHALIDGNKRLGWTATRLFFELNGYRVAASTDDIVTLVLDVATGQLSTVTKIAERLMMLASTRP